MSNFSSSAGRARASWGHRTGSPRPAHGTRGEVVAVGGGHLRPHEVAGPQVLPLDPHLAVDLRGVGAGPAAEVVVELRVRAVDHDRVLLADLRPGPPERDGLLH